MTKDTYVQTFDFAGKNVTLEAGLTVQNGKLKILKRREYNFFPIPETVVKKQLDDKRSSDKTIPNCYFLLCKRIKSRSFLSQVFMNKVHLIQSLQGKERLSLKASKILQNIRYNVFYTIVTLFSAHVTQSSVFCKQGLRYT
jgi:hypothetical protein